MTWGELKRVAEELKVGDDMAIVADDFAVEAVELSRHSNELMFHSTDWVEPYMKYTVEGAQ